MQTALATNTTTAPTSNEELIHSLEVKGYCVIENAVPPHMLAKIKEELQALENECTAEGADNGDRIIKQDDTRFMIHNLQFENCPTVHDIITKGPGTQLIEEATGDDLICTGATFAHCKPGFTGLRMHTDFDPYAANTYRPNNPVAVRALYYLTDLTPERSPLRLLPYSHHSLHKSKHFSLEFDTVYPEEVQFVCPAGTVVLFNPRMFHGVGPNRSAESRKSMTITFRPAWARPLHPVEELDADKVAKLSKELNPFFSRLNYSSMDL
jgi:ectoine hydroxylase-related dioxygenase (phytanoyl-CoA dioxygenase family)